MKTLPQLTHAEVHRHVLREIELMGSAALAARHWQVSRDLVSKIVLGKRQIGPKILRALKLRRIRLVVYRYERA